VKANLHGEESMRGTFAGPAESTYTFDQGVAAREREHAAYRKAQDRQDRAEAWLVERLAGLTFHSYDALVFAAVRHFELVRGAELTEDEARLLENAARAVWGGLAARAVSRLEINDVGRVASVTIRSAA
jgi:hypothetical protein